MSRNAALAVLACTQLAASAALAQPRPAVVEMQTNLGTIAIGLDYARAPGTADNFVAYVNEGFYRDTLIHRAVSGFVIQGGGYDRGTLALKGTRAPIALESNNGASNLTGTVAMARTNNPDSATSQFFVNLADNTRLDYVSPAAPGYAVFGRVVRGMDVVRRIGALRTFNAWDQSVSLPLTAGASLVWFEAVYTNDTWGNGQSHTRITVSGEGTVTSVPAGIDCGTECRITQAAGSALTLRAVPAGGFAFGGWRGDCTGERTTLRIDTTKGNHNCTAVFSRLGAALQ